MEPLVLVVGPERRLDGQLAARWPHQPGQTLDRGGVDRQNIHVWRRYEPSVEYLISIDLL